MPAEVVDNLYRQHIVMLDSVNSLKEKEGSKIFSEAKIDLPCLSVQQKIKRKDIVKDNGDGTKVLVFILSEPEPDYEEITVNTNDYSS
jgi:hypothetical protein